jgi:2'-5' RNA ligase
MSSTDSPDRMRDHWWWRPGWRAGRRMYTWHVTFDDQPQLHELVRRYQATLAPLPGLDLIPMRWLHLTVQGVAFTDEATPQEISNIAEATRKYLSSQQPVSLSVDPVRAGLRAAIAGERGAGQVPESEAWTPHISIAYSKSNGPASPYDEALNRAALAPVSLTVSAVHLIELSRDTHLYQWTNKAKVALSG